MIETTPKQALFVDYYLQSFNGTDAARKAGYKGNDTTLGVVASENLRKPCVINLLSKRWNQIAAKNEKKIINVYEEFTKNHEFVSKLRDASEKWLVDPEDPDKFTIDPRADEIDVVYWDTSGNEPVQKRAVLAELLSKVEHIAYNPTPFVKTVDLREYALKTVDRIDTTLDKFAKMGGHYTKDKENPQTVEAVIAQLTAHAEERRQKYVAQGHPEEEAAKVVQIALTEQIQEVREQFGLIG